MFRIRRIYEANRPVNKKIISEVQDIIRDHFPFADKEKIKEIPKQLENPLKYKFKTILFVADDMKNKLKGFGLMFHAPDLKFSYLDYMAVKPEHMGRGIGEAIYSRIREEVKSAGSIGLFFECLPDDPDLACSKEVLENSIKRLRFYEKFGAGPIINTKYETPLKPTDKNPPYLVFDSLGNQEVLSKEKLKKIVKAILCRKYSHLCPEGYIKMVVSSIKDEPTSIRSPKYILSKPKRVYDRKEKIVLVLNKQHKIHHVADKGYVESPVRISSILKELDKTDFFKKIDAKIFSEEWIRKVHDKGYIDYFKALISRLKPRQSIYPYVFPIRNNNRPPKELEVRAGYYCIDTFTPININAFKAARQAVNCALTGAEQIVEGERVVYALVRPPGHHAEKKSFGGFCYFNSNAIAAEYLSNYGKVAILDVDYHHGNGQQEIFYKRNDVLTISLHGHPDFAYPYFSGFEEENGEGEGKGYNTNYPLKEKITYEEYKKVLESAIRKIKRFNPSFLIIALGLDTAKKDPTGTWSFNEKDFKETGKILGRLNLPTLVVQEGGYKTKSLGTNALAFFEGFIKENETN
ncbi:MAG: GNAT family N-acetyltransferase [archaeon]